MPSIPIRELVDNAVDPKVRGFLHLPNTPNGNGLVLTHGAGSSATAGPGVGGYRHELLI